MSHTHNIIDTGNRFVINPELRTITTKTSELILTQGDHNSKRYTFEAPRIIEGHDMTLCNRIEIHYDNISRNKKDTSEGFYIADDLKIDGDNITFTWLISGNVTRLAGSVQFWINFMCVDNDGELAYSWGTDVFKGVRVIANNRNTEEVLSVFPDVLEQWKQEVLEGVEVANNESVVHITSPDENGNTLYLCDLHAGVYILQGNFKTHHGSDVLNVKFTANTLTIVTTEYDSVTYMHTTYVQVFNADGFKVTQYRFANSGSRMNTTSKRLIESETITNKVTTISDSSTNTQYPSAKAVKTYVDNVLGVIENGTY